MKSKLLNQTLFSLERCKRGDPPICTKGYLAPTNPFPPIIPRAVLEAGRSKENGDGGQSSDGQSDNRDAGEEGDGERCKGQPNGGDRIMGDDFVGTVGDVTSSNGGSDPIGNEGRNSVGNESNRKGDTAENLDVPGNNGEDGSRGKREAHAEAKNDGMDSDDDEEEENIDITSKPFLKVIKNSSENIFHSMLTYPAKKLI